MLTPYERSQLERAVDCIRAGCCPINLEDLAEILERCLVSDHRAVLRNLVYTGQASRSLRKALNAYGLVVDDDATVGELIDAIVRVESAYQDKKKKRGI